MRLSRCGVSAWCYDLLWYLSDLRYQEPRVFASLVGLLLALFVVVPVLVLASSGSGAPQPAGAEWPNRDGMEQESEHGVRYVAYNGMEQPRPGETQHSEALPADATEPRVILRKLSEVLDERLDESKLIYGSDGSEGSILPLDNGVVPSSGPRFDTSWELILPSAGIRAAVVQVGLTLDGAMGSPDNPFVVGWYNRSAVPGQLGNALLGGHRDYQDRDGKTDVGVCWKLDEARVGDHLLMFDQSTDRYYVYDIVDIATIRPDSRDAVRYLSQTRESVVTLITCSGDFDEETHSYEERIVVVALLNAVAAPDA